MKPETENKTPEVAAETVAQAPSEQASATPVAEPPKGMEFTEVSSASAAPVPILAHPSVTELAKPSGPVVADASKQSAPKKVRDISKPTGAIVTIIIVFIVLAGLAYAAYSNSK